jgi:serine phosphatase RsbU (regulator of sigma subunit)
VTRRAPIGTNALIVLLVGALITASLVIGSRMVNDANEQRLLDQRVREAGVVASSAMTSIGSPLTSASVLVDATGPTSASFRQLMEPVVGARNPPFVSVSVWSASGTGKAPAALVGPPQLLTQQSPAARRALFERARKNPASFAIYDLLGARDRRLGYAAAATPDARYVVYGEAALPTNRKARIGKDDAFAGLDYSLFLGTKRDHAKLVASSTGGAVLHGRTASTVVNFGDNHVLIVMSPRTDLGGALLARLWWILLILGAVLTLAAAALVERLTRRRREAEALAAENAQLYATQRSVASTLQQSLLAEAFPAISGVDFDARYVAGVEGIDIGGDWYDVIETGPNQVLLTVGDVSGRGLGAATRMASLRFGIRAYAAQGDGPAAILTKLSTLVNVARDGQFATACCATIDFGAQTITCASAGHLRPLLVDEAGAHYIDTAVGLPVGVEQNRVYEETQMSLPARGALFLYTDGLVERRGETLTDGFERLASAACAAAAPIDIALDAIVMNVIPDGSTDDTALLGVQWER